MSHKTLILPSDTSFKLALDIHFDKCLHRTVYVVSIISIVKGGMVIA